LSSECFLIQFFGDNSCKTCEAFGKSSCGGKNILKTGQNSLGFKIPMPDNA